METTANIGTPEKKSKKWLLGIGALAAIALAGLGTAYAKLDLFKSAKTIYLEAEANNLQQLADSAFAAYEEYEAYMKPYLEQPVHSTSELSAITLDAEIPDPAAQRLLDLLKEAKFVLDASMDQQKQQQAGKLILHLHDKPLTSLEYFQTDTLFGFKFPDFYSKYAYLDLNDRDALEEMFGEGLPKRFVTTGDVFKAIQLEKDEVKNALAPYIAIYADSLKDKQVSINKNVSFEEEGYKTSAREITVSFTREEASALLTQIAKKAKTDDQLFNLLYSRYEKLTGLMEDSGYPVEVLSRDEFKQKYDQFFADLIEDVEVKTKTDEQLKMVVLVDDDKQILARTLYFTGELGTDEQLLWSSTSFRNGQETYQRYSLHDPENAENSRLTITCKKTEESGKKDGSLSILLAEEGETLLDFSTTFATAKQEQKEEGTYSFTLSALDETSGKTLSLSGTVTSSLTETDGGRQSAADVTLNFDGFDSAAQDLPKGVSFKINSTEEFAKPLDIPVMNADNSVNLAALTDEQMMEIQQEVGLSVQQFMAKNAELFQSLLMLQ